MAFWAASEALASSPTAASCVRAAGALPAPAPAVGASNAARPASTPFLIAPSMPPVSSSSIASWAVVLRPTRYEARALSAARDAAVKSPENTLATALPSPPMSTSRSVTAPPIVRNALRPVSIIAPNAVTVPISAAPNPFTAPDAPPLPPNASRNICLDRSVTRLRRAISRCRSPAALAAFGPIFRPKRSASSTKSSSSVPLIA